MNKVNRLFSTYGNGYTKVNSEDASVHLKDAKKTKTPLNKLVFKGGDKVKVIKRGNGIMGRALCWLEDNIFSLVSQLKLNESKVARENVRHFPKLVGEALDEIGAVECEKNQIISQVNKRLRSRKPLRSGFVNDILNQVDKIDKVRRASPEHINNTRTDEIDRKTRSEEQQKPCNVPQKDAAKFSVDIFNKVDKINEKEIVVFSYYMKPPRRLTWVKNEFHEAFKEAANNAAKEANKVVKERDVNISEEQVEAEKNYIIHKIFETNAYSKVNNERFSLASKAQQECLYAVKGHNAAVREYDKIVEENKSCNAGDEKPLKVVEPWDNKREFNKVLEKCAKEYEKQVTSKLIAKIPEAHVPNETDD